MGRIKANIKSHKRSVKANLYNRSHKSKMKTYISKVDDLLKTCPESADLGSDMVNSVNDLFNKAMSVIMKAASKGVVKKKTASRKVSRLHKRVKKVIDREYLSQLS